MDRNARSMSYSYIDDDNPRRNLNALEVALLRAWVQKLNPSYESEARRKPSVPETPQNEPNPLGLVWPGYLDFKDDPGWPPWKAIGGAHDGGQNDEEYIEEMERQRQIELEKQTPRPKPPSPRISENTRPSQDDEDDAPLPPR